MTTLNIDWRNIHAIIHELGYVRIAITALAMRISWWLVCALFLSPLRNIRGPFLARITPLRAIYNRLPSRVVQAALKDYRTYGDLYVTKPNTVCISNIQDARTILASSKFAKMDIYHGLNDPVMANIVTFSDPSLASRRRRQIGPYFNHGYLAKMEPLILRNGIQAIKEKWDGLIQKNGNMPIEINYRKDTQLATFDIMSALAFGREFHSLASNRVTIVDWITATAIYIGIRINFNLLMKFPFSQLVKRWLILYYDFVQFGKESVAERKRTMTSGAEKPVDMLQAFIDAEDPESKVKMTSEEVQAESVGMQLAGSETTSASLTWALHLFTLYPQYLRQAVEEVRSQFAPSHLITYADCRNSLPFLECFLYEMLRYTPVTSGFMPRVSNTGISLQGHYIPPGTEIAFNLIAMNNREDIWDEPNKFNPNRFIDDEELKRNVLAFSYGPRSCLGRGLAWMEMMTILANLLKDYDFALPAGVVYGPKNLDANGVPRLMPSKCHIVFAPTNPDRDCRLLVSKRAV